MRNRWRVWLGLLVIAVLLLLLPPVHWRLAGWLKGDAYYLGRPTTYWSQEAARWNYGVVGFYHHSGNMTLGGPQWGWTRQSSLLDDILERIFGNRFSDGKHELELLNPEPAALPVLIELLADPLPQVQLVAIDGLRSLGQEAIPALPALRALADDENADGHVRGNARATIPLIESGPQTP